MVATMVIIAVAVVVAAFLLGACKVAGDADDAIIRQSRERATARVEELTTGIGPGSIPYRPVRYYRLPDPDVLSALPTGPLVSRGVNRMTPPLLWISTTPPVHEYLHRAFALDPVPDPYPEPWDDW
jgi:hypothetical protein